MGTGDGIMADDVGNMVRGQIDRKRRVSDIRNLYEQMRMRQWKLRERMARNYRYVIGDQLSAKVKSLLDQDGRPELVFNLTHNRVDVNISSQRIGQSVDQRFEPSLKRSEASRLPRTFSSTGFRMTLRSF